MKVRFTHARRFDPPPDGLRPGRYEVGAVVEVPAKTGERLIAKRSEGGYGCAQKFTSRGDSWKRGPVKADGKPLRKHKRAIQPTKETPNG